MTVLNADRGGARAWWRARGPVWLFVVAVVVAFVVLRVIAMSGVANPRLGGGDRLVTIDGAKYQQLVVRNEAPTSVTVEAARFDMASDEVWPELFEDLGGTCEVPQLVPYVPRVLAHGEWVVLYWSMDEPRYTSNRVEVRARTRSSLVRVTDLPKGPDLSDRCPE